MQRIACTVGRGTSEDVSSPGTREGFSKIFKPAPVATRLACIQAPSHPMCNSLNIRNQPIYLAVRGIAPAGIFGCPGVGIPGSWTAASRNRKSKAASLFARLRSTRSKRQFAHEPMLFSKQAEEHHGRTSMTWWVFTRLLFLEAREIFQVPCSSSCRLVALALSDVDQRRVGHHFR